MTGVTLTIDIDDAELQAEMKRKLAKLDNLAPFHKNVGEHMMLSVEERFETETAPDGAAWAQHAPATRTARLKKYGNAPLTILRAEGHLAGSFNYRADAGQVQIGSPIVYAAIHHFGGQAGRNRKVTIPARPILGLSPFDREAIHAMAEKFLKN